MTRRPRLPEPEEEVVDCQVKVRYLDVVRECELTRPHNMHRVVVEGTTITWTE